MYCKGYRRFDEAKDHKDQQSEEYPGWKLKDPVAGENVWHEEGALYSVIFSIT